MFSGFQLKEGGKGVSFSSFKDPSLADSMAILNLIDCIAPKKINWDYVKDGTSDEVSSCLVYLTVLFSLAAMFRP